MQQFRLRYRAHDIELPPGEFVIGRSEECQLSIDDAMVSRRHASIRVTDAGAFVVDLGSRNGVLVNGARINAERPLHDRDRISIGKHEMLINVAMPDSQRSRGFLARTLGPTELAALEAKAGGGRPPTTGTAKVVASLATLSQLADKMFALGRPEEAERVLSGPFADLMREMKGGAAVDPIVLSRFAVQAVKLASELQRASWVEWIFDAYGLMKYVIPAPIIDELLIVGPKLKHLREQTVHAYVKIITHATTITATERFLLTRLDGLAQRLAAGI